MLGHTSPQYNAVMTQRALLAAFTVCAMAPAQELTTRPSFEVASIKPADPAIENNFWVGMDANAGMVRYNNITLRDCIRAAYRLRDFQIQGPAWIGDARYEINARLGDNGREKIPEMLQVLLEERFHLRLRRDTKEQAVYALVIGPDGQKLKQADATAAGRLATALGPDGNPRPAMNYQATASGITLNAPAATLATVVDFLSRWMERPVVDLTALQGQFELTLPFVPEIISPLASSALRSEAFKFSEPGPTLFESVKKYGLRLEPRRIPLEMLTVLQADRVPVEN